MNILKSIWQWVVVKPGKWLFFTFLWQTVIVGLIWGTTVRHRLGVAAAAVFLFLAFYAYSGIMGAVQNINTVTPAFVDAHIATAVAPVAEKADAASAAVIALREEFGAYKTANDKRVGAVETEVTNPKSALNTKLDAILTKIGGGAVDDGSLPPATAAPTPSPLVVPAPVVVPSLPPAATAPQGVRPEDAEARAAHATVGTELDRLIGERNALEARVAELEAVTRIWWSPDPCVTTRGGPSR